MSSPSLVSSMSPENMLQNLARQLARRGLPRGYVRRVISELRDHGDDVRQESEGESLASRLGEPRALADEIVSAYRKKSFIGRHPLFALAVGPIPLAILIWAAVMAGTFLGLQWWYGDMSGLEPGAAFALLVFNDVWKTVVPFAVAGVAAWFAARSGHRLRWIALPCLLMAVWAAAFDSGLQVSPFPNQSKFTVGLGMSLFSLPPLAACLPLLVLAWHVIHRAPFNQHSEA